MNVQLHIKCSKNSDLVMSPRDLQDMYFYGITTRAKDGSRIPDHVYSNYIRAAQQELEKYLGIKLLRQVVEEDHNYYGTDWEAWGIIQTPYPVNEALSLTGFYGRQKHIQVPLNWLVAKRSSDDLYHRSVWLVPNGSGNIQQLFTVTGGVAPYLRIGQGSAVPEYWKLRYITGFNKVPMDLYNFVGKMAAMNVFNMLGDLVLGIGITSQSIGVDGLSQSISSGKSGTTHAFSARVNAYQKDLDSALAKLKDNYSGIRMISV